MDERLRRRVYPLDPKALTEEEMAAVFAMTSRSSDPLDEVARTLSPEKAAEFHQRWVLGRGHLSVSEHSVVRLAVENISRLACDELEDNRLGSYTERSSRYQVIEPGSYYVPNELQSGLRVAFVQTCESLLGSYLHLMEEMDSFLRNKLAPREGEHLSAYNFRIRHEAADSCRMLLPAATLTNVGVTMNSRVLRHAIEKLMSCELAEMRALAEDIRAQAEKLLPTLAGKAQASEYLVETSKVLQREASAFRAEKGDLPAGATLVQYDPDAEKRLAAALLYHHAGASYREVWDRVTSLPGAEVERLVDEGLKRVGPYELPLRETEYVKYTFEFVMDYGAYREFKRHRMQTYIAQPLTVDNGYLLPDLIVEAGKEAEYRKAMSAAEDGFRRVAEFSPAMAQYLVTHGHKRRVLAQMDLRQLYHFLRMRTSPHAHFTIRHIASEAMRLVQEKHPLVLRYLQLRKV